MTGKYRQAMADSKMRGRLPLARGVDALIGPRAMNTWIARTGRGKSNGFRALTESEGSPETPECVHGRTRLSERGAFFPRSGGSRCAESRSHHRGGEGQGQGRG